MAKGRQHKPAQLGKNRHVIHSLGRENLLVAVPHSGADQGNVAGRLLRAISHADAAGEVDKGDVSAGGVVQPHRQPEQLTGQFRIILIGGGIGGQECMNAEVLGAQFLQPVDGACHLVLRHAVLGIPGHIHNGIAQREGAAGIITQTNRLRHLAAADSLQEIHMGCVIQIDVSPHLIGLAHILLRRHIGGEHHIVTGHPHRLRQQQLRIAGAVAAAALLLQDFQDVGVGGSLHGKIFPEAFVPGEGRLQCPGIGPDASLVVQVEGGGNLLFDFHCLFQRHKRGLFHGEHPLFLGRQGAKNPRAAAQGKRISLSRQHSIR